MTSTGHRLPLFVLFSLLLLVSSSSARKQRAPDEVPARTDPPELTRASSEKRPAPMGLKLLDSGKFRLPAGIRIEPVTSPSLFSHPTRLLFDDQGTAYLLEQVPGEMVSTEETLRYQDGSTRKVRSWKKKAKDVLKVLSCSKKEGSWDQAQILFEDDFLEGALFHEGWLYVQGQGTLRRMKISKDKAGPPQLLLQGMSATAPRQGGGITLGMDGALYLTAGAGDHLVEGVDGSRATVLRSGAIFRVTPEGRRVETFAQGFCNPRGDVLFDLGGQMFHIDNDHPSGKFTGCRLLFVVDDGDYGWRLKVDSTEPDPLRAAVFGERAGILPPLLKTGRGTPRGLFQYQDSRFPEEFRGLLLLADPEQRTVRAYKVEPVGATFKVVEEFVFLEAPKDSGFRPCHLSLGPDGAIYLVDAQVKHPQIYRLSWQGTREQPALALRSGNNWAKIRTLKENELLQALSWEDASDREKARKELVRRGEKSRPALIRLLKDEEAPFFAKIHALGALQTMFNDDVQPSFLHTLREGDGELQRLAADALGRLGNREDRSLHDELIKLLATEDRMVRAAVARAMGRLAGPGAADSLVTRANAS